MQNKNWDKGAPTQVLRFGAKALRSMVVAKHVHAAGYDGAIIFTCGNAADALRFAFDALYQRLSWPQKSVLEVGPRGVLKTEKWWTPEEIHRAWPNLFDATSGHLPMPLMVKIAEEFKGVLEATMSTGQQWYVPTGSGETILCLRLAFPDVRFCAVYDNSQNATTRDNDAPLNAAVDALFPVEYWHGQLA